MGWNAGGDARADETAAAISPEFAAAVKLMEEERYGDAIPKLIALQQTAPGTGVQFNLAVCYMKTGRLGSAWKNFADVERQAKDAGKQQREEAARAKLDELRNRVPRLHIQVGEPRENAVVTVDGDALGMEEWAFVPLDPGPHRVVVSRPDRAEWSTTIDAPPPPAAREARDEEPPVVNVVVPEDQPSTSASAPIVTLRPGAKERSGNSPTNRKPAGYLIGGVGLLGLAGAIVTGALILDAKGTADDHCPGPCDDQGRLAVSRMENLMVVNAFAWVVAILGTGSGAWLLLTPSSRTTTPPTKTSSLLTF